MRHNTINNKYNISVDTNQGGSTELDDGEMLDGEVEQKSRHIAACRQWDMSRAYMSPRLALNQGCPEPEVA